MPALGLKARSVPGRDFTLTKLSVERVIRVMPIGIALLLLAVGCESRETPYDPELDELPRCQALRISYYPNPGPEDAIHWTVNEKTSARILAKLAIRGQEKGTQYGIGRNLLIIFVTQKGSLIETQFVKPDQLDRSDWGQILLKDNRFYKAICTEVSKRIGQPYSPFE